MIRPCALALICALIHVSAAAAAQAAQSDKQATFESLDKNADGKVSVAEASEHDSLFVAFKNLDKDRDGQLTREEFAGYKPQKSGA